MKVQKKFRKSSEEVQEKNSEIQILDPENSEKVRKSSENSGFDLGNSEKNQEEFRDSGFRARTPRKCPGTVLKFSFWNLKFQEKIRNSGLNPKVQKKSGKFRNSGFRPPRTNSEIQVLIPEAEQVRNQSFRP